MQTSNPIMIPEEINKKLKEYARLIHEYNKTINITGLKDIDSIYNELIIGSINPLLNINVPRGTSFVDIGTGAGIPGIPLLLYFGDNINIQGTLVDSNNKKIKFLLKAVDSLGMGDRVRIIHGRVEDMAKDASYRDSFSFAVARAFAHPLMALEYGLPFVKVGGWLYIYYSFNMCEMDSQNNEIVCRDAFVIAKPSSIGLHKSKGACQDNLVAIIKYLQMHSYALGGHMATTYEAKKHNIFEGFLFIKDKLTSQNYPRRHAVIKREVEKIRDL